MTVSHTLLLLASACLGVSSCATQPEPSAEKKPAPAEGPKLVGRIASIPAERRFVLIQSYGKWNVASGAILTTRGPDARSANLRTTGESLGEYAAADLQAGLVEVGDAVYSQHVPKPVDPLATPTTETLQGDVPTEKLPKTN